MQPLDLNLASRPFRNNAPIWAAYVCGAAVAGAATYGNVSAYLDSGARLQRLREQVETVGRKLGELDVREQKARRDIEAFDVKVLSVQARRANGVIQRRALSWTKLFNELERIQPYEVRLSSVRPLYGVRGESGAEQAQEGLVPVSVEGTARSLRAFTDYEYALIHDPHFMQVEPQRATIGDGGEVYFDLRFLYAPAGGAEAGEPAQLEPDAAPGSSLVAEAPESEEAPPEDVRAPAEGAGAPEPEAAGSSPVLPAGPERPPNRAAVPAPRRPPAGAIETEPTPEELERAKSWKPAIEFEPADPEAAEERPRAKGPRKGRS